MVTIGSLLAFILLLTLITFIDAVVYEISFITALFNIFDAPMGLGRTILYVFTFIGFIIAIINDVRRKKAS